LHPVSANQVAEGGVLQLLRSKFASPEDIFLLQWVAVA
jgi:hypothetical protein